MERGFGHTPMGDHCANACAFEVVLSRRTFPREVDDDLFIGWCIKDCARVFYYKATAVLD